MRLNRLQSLGELGQSIWLDYIRRDLIASGELQRLITNDGLRGMTSNPAIFEKAIADSTAYDADILALAQQGKSSTEIYEAISQRDVQSAADAFKPLYEDSSGVDGYVSLEVNPHLAHDTQGTIAEARRLWAALDRPNVLIKVPATSEGLPAIRQLIRDGINVNVTLLFGLPRYQEVAEAYLSGIEARVADGKAVSSMASVASFFIGRIDALIDPILDSLITRNDPQASVAKQVHGQTAIACAKLAYNSYVAICASERFTALANHGVRSQRLLWASTGTKNAAYSDVKYVDALIGPDTVNTVPPATLNAFRDHGTPANHLAEDLAGSRWIMERLPELGIDIDVLTRRLENEGVAKFITPFDTLIQIVNKRSAQGAASSG